MTLAVVPDLSRRLPPHDFEAETAVLSALLLGGRDFVARVADFLRPEHFFSEAHRRIYEAAYEIFSESADPVDVKTVLSWLKQRDRIAQVGGVAGVTEILNESPAVANVPAHARIVYERWRERCALAAAQTIEARGYLGVTDTQAYLDDATRFFSELARASVLGGEETNTVVIQRVLAALYEKEPTRSRVKMGIKTGIESYDAEWGGFHGTDLTTFCALPNAGKTTIGLQVALASARSGVGAIMFCQDMSREDLLVLSIAHVGSVDSDRIRRAMRKEVELSASEWARLAEAANIVADLPIWFDDTRGMHVDTLRARATARVEESLRTDRRPIGLVVVDYYQQLGPTPHMRHRKKVEYLGETAAALKSFARESGLSVVALAQQVQKDNHGKMVWRAADCSEIFKESNNFFFIVENGARARTLRCEKVRAGTKKSLDLAFDGAIGRFSDARLEAASRVYVPPPEDFFTQGDTE